MILGMDQASIQLKGFYDLINTTAGSSVLLPTMYFIDREDWNGFDPSFKWQHNGGLILFFSGENCSLASEGFFQNCSGKPYGMGGRIRDISFFPENASIMLHNVQKLDSGWYKLQSRYSNDTIRMTLSVAGYDTMGKVSSFCNNSSQSSSFISRKAQARGKILPLATCFCK